MDVSNGNCYISMDRMEVDLVLMKELYSKYRSLYVNNRMTEGQNKNLKNWHERRDHIGITLSQIDHWMMEADIIPKTMTIFDTGTTFSKLKTFAVDFEDLLSFIDQVSAEKSLDPVQVKLKMLEVNNKT